MTINDETEKLLRDFLLRQSHEEQGRLSAEQRRIQDHLEIKKTLSESSDSTVKAFQAFSHQMSAKFAQFEHDMSEKLDDIRRRADAAHALAMGAHARFDLLKEGADANRRKTESGRYQKVQHGGLQSPWDVGTESPTGSHVIVPIDQHEASKKNWDDFIDEALKTRELLHDGDTWRWLKENASKIVVAAMASVLAAFLIATVVTSTVAGLPKALPPQPTPSPQHP